jgi:hypothetical protein
VRCCGCQRRLGVGDRYIEDAASGFLKQEGDAGIDSLIAELMGGRAGKVVVCEDCTREGGDYVFETVYEDEA